MSLLDTSYGIRRADLRKLVASIKPGLPAKTEKSAALKAARTLAAKLSIDLGDYNSSDFAKGV